MARIDKYDPISGGFRAALGFATITGELETIIAVGLNSSGQVVKGSGATGVCGVLVLTKNKIVGDIVDVMTDGELVDCVGLAAGTRYYGSAAGAVNTTNTDVKLGYTVDVDRLVVRMGR